MSRFYDPIEQALLEENGYRSSIGEEIDPPPILKLFTTNSVGIWLITELDPFYPGMAFGLCDLGFGSPELGNVYLPELEEAMHVTRHVPLVERDHSFKANYTLSVFAEAAKNDGSITTENDKLNVARQKLKPK